MAHFMAHIIAAEIIVGQEDPLVYLDEWVRRRPDTPEPLAYIIMAAYHLGERDAKNRVDNRPKPA